MLGPRVWVRNLPVPFFHRSPPFASRTIPNTPLGESRGAPHLAWGPPVLQIVGPQHEASPDGAGSGSMLRSQGGCSSRLLAPSLCTDGSLCWAYPSHPARPMSIISPPSPARCSGSRLITHPLSSPWGQGEPKSSTPLPDPARAQPFLEAQQKLADLWPNE